MSEIRYEDTKPLSKSGLGIILVATVFTFVAAIGLYAIPVLASTAHTFNFTQEELDDNWVADRQYPSGDVESVSFDGRDNVAKVGVVAEEQSSDSFRQFEGIKSVDDFGTAVQVDLYVPSEWQDADVVNVGFWASDDDPISSYPIIVYRNSDTVDAGFYTWTYDWDAEAWIYAQTDAEVNYDGWNTLSIALSDTENVANYAINGEDAGSVYNAGSNIGQVFLNHYNDGERDYDAYWHGGVAQPQAKNECKQGGWSNFDFRNQGLCIQFVNTGRDSR